MRGHIEGFLYTSDYQNLMSIGNDLNVLLNHKKLGPTLRVSDSGVF